MMLNNYSYIDIVIIGPYPIQNINNFFVVIDLDIGISNVSSLFS